MKNIIALLFLAVILNSCGSDEKRKIFVDRFVFDKMIEDTTKKYLFVKSQFSDLLKQNHFEEITWILCNKNDLDSYFDSIATEITINQEHINFGSYLLTLKNEYLHIKLNDGRTGWLKDSIAIPAEQKRFLKDYLTQLINKDRKQAEKRHRSSFYCNQDILYVNGYLTITHFADKSFALLKYSPILKVTSDDHNLIGYQIGYIADLKEQKIFENYLESTGQLGMNFDSNYVFDVRRDPYYFKALDQHGNTVKAEGIAE